MKKVYFISGLGADKRVFSFLNLDFCEPVFIDWIEPIEKESLIDYAFRLRKLIPEKDPIVVGVSLGGMLASEMAKAEPNLKAIIISSNKTSLEFPRRLRIGKYIPLYKWLPGRTMNSFMRPFKGLLGAKGKIQKGLLKQIIKDADPQFMKWAIPAILHWKNVENAKNIIHIHGTADRLLPYRLVKADYTIKDGTHVMLMEHHEEMSELLKKLIV